MLLKSNRFRVHAFFLTLLAILILIAYQMYRQRASILPDSGDVFVRISSASFGLNCRPEDLRPSADAAPIKALGKFADPQQDEKDKLVVQDNALSAISERCNGKTSCALTATPEALGLLVSGSCRRQLNVEYRCFSYDRPWLATIRPGETLLIDCVKQVETQQ